MIHIVAMIFSPRTKAELGGTFSPENCLHKQRNSRKNFASKLEFNQNFLWALNRNSNKSMLYSENTRKKSSLLFYTEKMQSTVLNINQFSLMLGKMNKKESEEECCAFLCMTLIWIIYINKFSNALNLLENIFVSVLSVYEQSLQIKFIGAWNYSTDSVWKVLYAYCHCYLTEFMYI